MQSALPAILQDELEQEGTDVRSSELEGCRLQTLQLHLLARRLLRGLGHCREQHVAVDG